MKAGINAVTAALVVGIGIGLVLTPDGRAWLRRPTLMLGAAANASAGPGPGEPAAPPVVAPVLPTLTPLQEKAARGSLRIGVFGNSMGDGLWTALYRDLRAQPGVTVTKFSEVSTGLSRYDYVDIQAKTARQIAEQPVDVAVILFGTNDAQGISMDGEIHDFGTEGWKVAYARRVDDLVAMLRGRDIAVYWVGLPKMKRAGFDAKMALINGVVSARMVALGVPYIETESLTENADGEYDAYLPETGTGRRRLMRANDGIHMSMAGYLRIAEPVAARLKRDAGLDAPVVPTAPAAGV
ncbi:hypothetical protein MMB232_01672 [Brevundimonas subvibrioides]|uniref:SGNH/GDSL hydrolase family protein n=1 Tax=Brevundimonas subvibrioides TaxID=74313 RepID=UPI0032D583D0